MSTQTLTPKHFSRFGEFIASFELSKRGWNVYSPMYDEYFDLIIHKVICKKCGRLWNPTPALVCNKCGLEISSTNKSRIIAYKICKDCGYRNRGNIGKCKKCGSKNLFNRPSCYKQGCNGIVKIRAHKCNCGSRSYKSKFRTIQVKSSRVEYKGNKCKNTFAVDMKPRDLLEDPNHFYIWICIDQDDDDKIYPLVLSVNDFEQTMGNALEGISFLKDQDRQHFSKDFMRKGHRWGKYLNNFDILE
ncbi:MAG: hypothetical protein ISS47_10335 [Candidatus Omnitrophica bacterium]|nr:hypothetical protein [Candidatus Omnitrophota bacterium]